MAKILIVEDSKEVLNNIVQLLQYAGYDTYTALNAQDGIEIAKEVIPDLIISDIMMPGIDGFEFLDTIKKNSATDTIPFIFLTAKVEMNDIRKGMVGGADDYVSKPFKAKDLLDAVKTQLQKKAKRHRLFEEIYRNISTYVPHELRTPLVSIYGYTDMLLNDYDNIPADEARHMLASVKASTDRLYKTLEKFMMFAELELIFKDSQKFEMLRSGVVENPSLLINEAINKKKHSFQGKRNFSIKLSDVPVKITEEHFRYLLQELFENAFKFSADDTVIEVTSTVENKNYKLSVLNRGMGMTSEEISNTHPFIQHKREILEQPGNGLGLVTIQRIVKFYKGKFNVESDGTTYTKVTATLKTASLE